MNATEARTRLESMTAWDQAPTLTAGEITALLAASRRIDRSFRNPDDDTDWIASTAYALDDRRAPITRNGHVYIVTTAGTSGLTEPAWPLTAAGTIVDGGVTWTENGLGWAPTYALNAAAAEGWRWKAGKVAGKFGFATDQQIFNREHMNKMCLAMADRYAKRVSGNIRIGGALPVIQVPTIPVPSTEF